MTINDAEELRRRLLADDAVPTAEDILEWSATRLDQVAFDEELLAARFGSGDEALVATARRRWFQLLGDRLQAGQTLTQDLIRRDAGRSASQVLPVHGQRGTPGQRSDE